ncbi:MAG: hypothetical protein NUW37_17420 [Planctomycetes bacterium]|nr:hypothetical protein [Planctomycetota bacterium]
MRRTGEIVILLCALIGLFHAEAKAQSTEHRGELTTSDTPTSDGRFADVYEVEFDAGTVLTVEIIADWDTFLIIEGPDDFREVDDDGGEGLMSRLTVELPRSGTYRISVTSYGEGQNGEYTVRWSTGGEAGPSIVSEQPEVLFSEGNEIVFDGEIDEHSGISIFREGCYSVHYEVEVAAGDRFVAVVESEDFDTYLYALDEDIEIIVEDDDGFYNTNSGIQFDVEYDGAVRIEVTSFEPGQSGAFTLRVFTGNDVPTFDELRGDGEPTVEWGHAEMVDPNVHTWRVVPNFDNPALDQTISCSFSEAPLSEVLSSIFEHTEGLSYILNAGASRMQVTCELREIPVRDALTAICQVTGTSWWMTGESIIVVGFEQDYYRQSHIGEQNQVIEIYPSEEGPWNGPHIEEYYPEENYEEFQEFAPTDNPLARFGFEMRMLRERIREALRRINPFYRQGPSEWNEGPMIEPARPWGEGPRGEAPGWEEPIEERGWDESGSIVVQPEPGFDGDYSDNGAWGDRPRVIGGEERVVTREETATRSEVVVGEGGPVREFRLRGPNGPAGRTEQRIVEITPDGRRIERVIVTEESSDEDEEEERERDRRREEEEGESHQF